MQTHTNTNTINRKPHNTKTEQKTKSTNNKITYNNKKEKQQKQQQHTYKT